MNRTEAQTALDRLQEEKRRAVDELTAAREALDRLETESGDRLLAARLDADEDAAASIRDELAAGRLAVAEGEKIVAACERAIEAAQLDVLAAEAREIREQIVAEWPDVEARLDRAAAMLAKLREVEGVAWLPQPHVLASGAVPAGSWARTSTGEAVAVIVELERKAAALERRAKITSPTSIMSGRADLALHLGCEGVVEAVRPLTVGGSVLDGPSAVLAGKPAPETPNPSRDEIARQTVMVRR